MSWHYSQALVAAYSADTSSAGAPSAPSSGNLMPLLYCALGRMKAFSRLSRFGMTCKPLTEQLGADVLTWCLAVSHAKTLAQPERAQESTESGAECGRTWRVLFARWDRATSSWRTPQCSLLEGLDEFSETWPRWGMMRDGACSAQLMPAHLIGETESGLWGTPRVGMVRGGNFWFDRGKCNLEEQVGAAEHARMWPNPTCHNAKEQDSPSEARLDTPTLCHQARGGDKTQPKHLNPVWVEWLMGWPLGWTDLKPSDTAKFQQWQHSHGGS